MTDPITDMLNQIRNAYAVEKTEVVLPFSQMKQSVADVLVKAGFIAEAKKGTKGKAKSLKISLKYQQGLPAMEGAKRVSRPGQRIYAGFQEIKNVKGGFGISIISTSRGLMTNAEARKAKLGGEVLLEVW